MTDVEPNSGARRYREWWYNHAVPRRIRTCDPRRGDRVGVKVLGSMAMFGSLGLPELLIILFIVVLIFGANRLPSLAKGLGSSVKNFKEGMKDGEGKS